MPEYLEFDITVDPAVLLEDGVEAIRDLVDDSAWAPSPIEEWLLSAVARMAVEIAILAGRVPLSIFTYFGDSVLGVAVLEGAQARGTVTFTLADAAGHTIADDAQIDIDGVPFTTDAELVVPAGQSAGTVGVTAVEAGTAANDLPAGAVDLVSPTYVFVNSVALNAPTSGGTDAETAEDYADRLADELPTLSPKAILIGDFEALARRNPLVGRALAIDNYDPGPPIVTTAEGHVTVAVHDVAGEVLAAGVRATIEADLEANRVLNIDVHVIDPTYTTIKVSFTATVYPGWSAASVDTEAEQAIRDFLSPATWGRPALGDPTDWVQETTVLRNDLMGVLYGVPGIRHVSALTLAETSGTLGTADVALTGAAPLPRPGTITGTVT